MSIFRQEIHMSLAYVYIIGPNNGPYKVGWSASPHTRLHSLQTGTTEYLRLHYKEETETSKAKVIEKLIHRQLAHKRIRGEWFAVTLQEAIAEVKYAFIRWEDEPALAFRFKRRLL
jgi:hypothetical protein